MKRIFLVIGLLIVCGCSLSSPPEKGEKEEFSAGESAAREEEMPSGMERFNVAGFDDEGEKKWEVEGETAEIFEDSRIKFKNIVAHAYEGESLLTLTADEGIFEQGEGNLTVEKNVVATTEEGAELTTESLTWYGKDKIIKSDDFCRIRKDTITIEGEELEADINIRQAWLKRNIEVRIEPDTLIICDGPLEFREEENLAIFYNSVEVQDKEGELSADKIEVWFHPQTRKITQIVSVGKVEILREGNIANCGEALYRSDEGRVVLTQRPRLFIYPE